MNETKRDQGRRTAAMVIIVHTFTRAVQKGITLWTLGSNFQRHRTLLIPDSEKIHRAYQLKRLVWHLQTVSSKQLEELK